MNDYIVKATMYDGMVRAYAAVTTDTIEEARRRQDSWATTTAALGRTMTITAMMGAMLKGDDKLTARLEGNGAIGPIVADANALGHVRGYVTHPHVDYELNEQGKLDVRRAVGIEGSLSIVKDLGLKEYFTGQVPIVSGEVSEDFTYYFASSEQTPSAVGAGVLINPNHTVKAAGGFIIQLMPGATDETIDQLEADIAKFQAISQLVEAGHSPEGILAELFTETDIKLLESLPVEFRCECSKDRIAGAIKGLGAAEVEDMIRVDKGAEATCHFCNEVYTFNEAELEELLD